MRSNSPLPAKPRLLNKSAQRNSIRSMSLYKSNENNLVNNDFIRSTPSKENYKNSPEKKKKTFFVSNLYNFPKNEHFQSKEQRDTNELSKETDLELTIGDNYCKPFELENSFGQNILKEDDEIKNRLSNTYLQNTNLSSNYIISNQESQRSNFEHLLFKKKEKINGYSYLEEDKIWNKNSARDKKITFEKISDDEQIKQRINVEFEKEKVQKNTNLEKESDNLIIKEETLPIFLIKEDQNFIIKENDCARSISKGIPVCDKENDLNDVKKGKNIIHKMVKDCLYRTKEVINTISSDQKSLSKKIISDKMRNHTIDPNTIISCFKLNEESKCEPKLNDSKKDYSLILNKNDKETYSHEKGKIEKINPSNEELMEQVENIDMKEQKKRKSITMHEVNKMSPNYNESTFVNILCNMKNSLANPNKNIQNALIMSKELANNSNSNFTLTPVKTYNIDNKENAFRELHSVSNRKNNDSSVKQQNAKSYVDPPLCHIPKSSSRANSSNSKMKQRIDAMFTEAITRSHATISKHEKISEQLIKTERLRGKQIYPDQTIYEGDLIQSVRTGFGILKTFSSEIIYSGDWLKDRFNGKGKLYKLKNFKNSEDFYSHIILLDFQYEIENLILKADQWERFEGEFKDGFVCGLGTIFFNNERNLKGEWKEGKFLRRIK